MSESASIVQVFDIVGTSVCVSSTDGERLYEKILPPLSKGHHIELSFTGVDIVITAFLNAAIGRLHGSITATEVDRLLSWSGLDTDDDDLLDKVIENAKYYFSRPRIRELAWNGSLEDEDDQ